MKIGLICEGITDYIVLENLLCNYLTIDDEDIKQLQPLLDETDKKQANFGGWEQVLVYLQSTDFVNAVENHDYLIVQIDTDVCEHKNFGVSPISLADNNQAQFYELIKQRLISQINQRYNDNFEKYAPKIIFCICIHSLECWLLIHYQTTQTKQEKITGCENSLNNTLNKQNLAYKKDYAHYNKLSQKIKPKDIELIAKHSFSFGQFLQQVKVLQLLTITS